MTQVLALPPRHMETGLVHSFMDLDSTAGRGGSSSAAMEARHSPSPLHRTSSIRKRAASLSTPDMNSAIFEQGGLASSTSMNLETSRELICLCTPAPKIPRPRNAFILYRQHHQARVTADNPKLSNPEISKIIGEKWKNEVEDVKETWKKLAEEEKQRHQHQYPNYRYQPRRGARAQGSWPGPSPTDDQGRCPKCNGRFIATPRTPATPFTTPPPTKTPTQGLRDAPTLRGLDTGMSPRMGVELSPVGSLSFPAQLPPVRGTEELEPMSPELKRRRANTAGNYHIVSGIQGDYLPRQPPELVRMSSEGLSSTSMRLYAPLPEPRHLPRSQSGPMPPPPPRPPGSGTWGDPSQTARRHSGFDESLRLPPLQTSVSPSSARFVSVEGQQTASPVTSLNSALDRAVQDRALEAAVMSLPFKRKLSILSRICRPAPPLGSAFVQTRGPFIAIEGPSGRMLREAGQIIENSLLASDEVALRVWGSEFVEGDGKRRDDSAISQSDRNTNFEGDDVLPPHFQISFSWQRKSRQIAQYVTSDPPTQITRKPDDESRIPRAQPIDSSISPVEGKSPTLLSRVPVALVKEGFSLTLSNRFACRSAITDAYAPVDHWQWMASLFRGTISPDLVVYVQPSSEEEITQLGAVEVSRQMGLIVVRVPMGMALEEATARRLAFEVMEWMRAGLFRDPVPEGWRHDSN